jgi:hypothetical protein
MDEPVCKGVKDGPHRPSWRFAQTAFCRVVQIGKNRVTNDADLLNFAAGCDCVAEVEY